MSKSSNELYEFGDFRLDVSERKLDRTDGTKNCPLPEKAFQTLAYLVRHNGTLLTKEELLTAVWPDTAVEENNLGKAVHAIRQCLGDSAGEQRYVETVPKHGYRFVADVRRVNEGDGLAAPGSEAVPASGVIEEKADRPEPSAIASAVTRDKSAFPRGYLIAAAGLLLIGILVVWVSVGARSTARPDTANAEANTASVRGSDPRASRAYDLYVRGKVKVASENPDDTEAAIKLLEQAIGTDPDLAEAHAQLARAYNTMAFKYSEGPESKQFHENAEVEVEKALALNPDLAEAHFARGLILWSNAKGFPHEQAIQSYKRSLALNPNNDEAYHQLSTVYSHIGLLDEADDAVKKALALNPNNTLARYRAGVYLAYRGKFDDALAVYKTIPRDATPLLVDRAIAEALIHTGKLDEAERLADEYLSRYPHDEGGSFTSVKALILALRGKTSEADVLARRAVEIGSGYGHFHHTAYNAASVYAVLNRPEEAVKWLQVAADTGFPNYPYFEIDPNLNNIRPSKQFVEFMGRLKQRWERYKAVV